MRRVPVVMQLSQTDCAAACLAMVARAYGAATPIGFWQDALGSGRDGTTVARMISVAGGHGLTARAFAVTDLGSAVATGQLPGVLHVDGNHFVVVVGARSGRIQVVDPRIGRRWFPVAELSRRVTGPLVLFRPTARLHRVAARRRLSLRGVVLRSSRGLRLQLLLSTLLMVLATLGPSLLMSTTVNHLLRSARPGMPRAVIVATVGCLGVQVLGTLLQGALVLRLRTRMDLRLMTTFVRRLLAKDLVFLEQRAAGDILSRIASNAALRDSLTLLLMAGGMHLPLAVIYAIAMVAFSPYLAVIAFVGAGLQVLAAVVFGRRAETAQRESLRAESELQIHSVDVISNYAIVKAMRLEAGVAGRWLSALGSSISTGLRRDSEIQVLQTAVGMIQLATPISIVLGGAWLASNGVIRYGSVLATLTIAGIFLTTVGRLVTGAQGIYLVRGHLERLEDVVDARPGPRSADPQPPTAASGTKPADATAAPAPVPAGRAAPSWVALRLDRVSFRYGSDADDVLRGITLDVEPGELLGIGGRSGCGKTTLMHLLLGLYRPGTGTVSWQRVTADGAPVSAGDLRYAYVPQDPELFSGTVRDNVVAWRQGVADVAVWEALDRMAVRRDVEAMPLGLDTPIGGRGLHLSGGQRQRLALARAVLAAPDLLVADEPTSHLDSSLEQTVLASLRRLSCTRVVVAHSPQVLSACDRAVHLDSGRLRVEPMTTATTGYERTEP